MQELHVKGMRCERCSAAVERALNAQDGVQNVHVDLGTGVVTFDAQQGKKVDLQAAKEAIRDAGFDVA